MDVFAHFALIILPMVTRLQLLIAVQTRHRHQAAMEGPMLVLVLGFQAANSVTISLAASYPVKMDGIP